MFFKSFKTFTLNKRIYLDYASSTPLDYKMLASFPKIPKEYLVANPGALHYEGVQIKKYLREARNIVSKTLNAHSDEIIFTSSATESDNLAISGSIKYFLENGVDPKNIFVYTSPFEHSAVSGVVSSLNKNIVTCVLNQESGEVITKNIVVQSNVKVLIISIIFVQNEIGSVQPVKEIAKHLRRIKKDNPEIKIIFHIDATQAPSFYDLNVNSLGIDMMTLGATKLYCPKGVGVLYKKRNVNLLPILYGGGQEAGLRPSTQAVDLIHKFAYSLEYAKQNRQEIIDRTKILQRYFEDSINKYFPKITITKSKDRSPHITHLVVPGIDSELLVIELDAKGVALSSKSACKNDTSSVDIEKDSDILSLLYPNQNLGAIRVSYGRFTTKRELNRTIKAIKSVLLKYKILD